MDAIVIIAKVIVGFAIVAYTGVNLYVYFGSGLATNKLKQQITDECGSPLEIVITRSKWDTVSDLLKVVIIILLGYLILN
jgi:hypothetical protein